MRQAKSGQPPETSGQAQTAVPPGLQGNSQAQDKENLPIDEKDDGPVYGEKIVKQIAHESFASDMISTEVVPGFKINYTTISSGLLFLAGQAGRLMIDPLTPHYTPS
jgi:hypothetical protein